MNQKLEGQIRHILTLVAGFLSALGFIETEILEASQQLILQIVSVGFAVVAFVRSYITKSRDEDVEKVATAVAEKVTARLSK